MKKILIILPRGETFRNFLYSGIISELKKKYYLVIVSVKPNEELWSELKENSDELYELKKTNYSYFHRYVFGLLDLAHNRYMWSESAKYRWQRKDIEAKKKGNFFKRAVNKNLAILFSKNKLILVLEKFDRFLSKFQKSVKYWDKYFKNNQIDLVFNTSHSHSRNASQVVYAARPNKVKTCTFLFSWDNLTSQGRVNPEYDFIFSWNSEIKQDFHNIYPHYSKEQVLITGTPQFINHFSEEKTLSKKELYKSLNLKEDAVFFLYSSGMSHHMPYEPYVVERIADIIYKINPSYKLVVRTYAKDRFKVFDYLKTERKDIIIPEVKWELNFQTPLMEDNAFYISLLKNCVAGINVASTISLELCMLDKPVINVGYDPPNKNVYPYDYKKFYSYDHYKPIVESGAIALAYNEIEMESYLREVLVKPEKRKKERAQLIFNFFEGRLDDSITTNFVDVINEIVNK